MNKWFLALCLVFALGSLSFGQKVAQRKRSQQETAQQKALEAESARQRAAALLEQLPEQIKLMDEPALRVLLRLEIVSHFWGNQRSASSKGNDSSKNTYKNTTVMVKEALADLEEHEKDIPRGFAQYARTRLISLLQLHAPELAARLVKSDAPEDTRKLSDTDIANSLFASNNIEAAVEKVRSSIRRGNDPGSNIVFFLTRLEKGRPNEFPRLLSELLTVGELKQGGLSVETLSWLSSFYLSDKTSPELKARFCAVAINVIGESSTISDRYQLTYAHSLVNSILPFIEKLTPSLYGQALAQASALASRIPQQEIERLAIARRVKESDDPLEQLITEAKSVNDSSLKDDLLTEAAQLALKKEELRKAVDLADSTSAEGDHGRWRDQFLGDVVSRAIAKKDLELAGYAISKIQSALKRANELQKLAQYYIETKESDRAHYVLIDAVKLIDLTDDSSDKAVALLNIATSFSKINDVPRFFDLVQRSINVINKVTSGRLNPDDKSNSDAYVTDTLIPLASYIIPVFQSLARKDEWLTNSLIIKIQPKEIRGPAVFGSYLGALGVAKDLGSAEQTRMPLQQD
ncbi:MAG: hypothetical protein ABR556_12725 [Pyrinomonadaceae bacterium]